MLQRQHAQGPPSSRHFTDTVGHFTDTVGHFTDTVGHFTDTVGGLMSLEWSIPLLREFSHHITAVGSIGSTE
jgi:hypothetical protein